jgi:aminotransferase
LPEFVREHSGLAIRRRRTDELDAFVETAADKLDRVYGVRVAQTAILPAPSGRAAMSALAATLIGPGDGVLVTEPGYPAFARVAAQQQARIGVVPLDPERGFAPDLEALDERDRRLPIRIAALNYPNNPTGSIIPEPALEALRDRLDSRAVIFNDAIYGPLTYERPPFSLLGGDCGGGDAAGILELHSLGKLFTLGPLGLAFLVGRQDLIDEVRQYSDFAWTQLSSLQVRVAARCLQDWQHVDKVRGNLHRRIDTLRSVLTTLGFEPYPVAAGMYVLCRRPTAVGRRPVGSAEEAADALLQDHGLAVAPWDVPPHGYVRFSAAYLPEEIDALAGLGRSLELVTR